MVSPEAPWPATTGGLVRIAAICNQMARYCDLTFVSPRRPDQKLPDDPRVRFICPEVPAAGVVRRIDGASDHHPVWAVLGWTPGPTQVSLPTAPGAVSVRMDR